MPFFFLPFGTTAAGGINSLTASQEGRCSFLTTVNRSGQCSQSSSKTLHLDSCFNFCNGFFPHSSLPSPPLPSTPHTNSCKLTILRCKPFSTPHSLKTSRVCFGGHVMKQKISFPKKDWDRHFGFWNHLWSGTFPLQKGHAFCFSKCLTSFSFFLWYPLAVSREKKKEKKKKNLLMVLCAG